MSTLKKNLKRLGIFLFALWAVIPGSTIFIISALSTILPIPYKDQIISNIVTLNQEILEFILRLIEKIA